MTKVDTTEFDFIVVGGMYHPPSPFLVHPN